ncbi:MAG TPA: MoaD/ThiS family protein [Nitrospiria bacterium]|nr:MoaD/ThiS family protein [Nitrospiria bacterium]
MRVTLQQPLRETEVSGAKTVRQLLRKLDLIPEAVLVIRNNELVTEDEKLREDDLIEIRSVISGG